MSLLLHTRSLGAEISAPLAGAAESGGGAASAMPLWGLILMISASGFAIAGLVNAFGQFRHSAPGLTTLSLDTPAKAAWSVIFCMFAGPYWMAGKAVEFWQEGDLPTLVCAMFVVMAVMWSFCSGVVILQLMHFLHMI